MTRPGLLLLALALALRFGPGAPAAAEDEAGPGRPTIYKWVDRNGIAHYTTDPDRVPRNLRDRIRDVPREPETPAPAPAPARSAREDLWSVRDAGSVEAEVVERAPLVEPDVVEAAPSDPGGTAAPEAPDAPANPAATAAVAPAAGSAGGPETDAIARLDREIAELEVQIARDEEALKALISRGVAPDGSDASDALYDSEEFQRLARRFPRLQADLAALRQERARLSRP